ncbi:uncharacterized protein LOC142163425 [Nicotiana tabacum]|uniref:Uncharacterized protein LOC142163425 n=1 Tax=Nicotiana tabacum TaxID=4097 RepID=A0AC58RVZ3_TOBAC
MEEEAENFVANCDKCQRYGNNMHRPTELIHLVIAPWPFLKWGMDIVGPIPQAKGKVKFLLVLTNYFTKWVEAGSFKQKRLEESKGNCPELLPGVLWAYHTTTKTSTDETSFSLVYGAEALIPVEIGEPSTRYMQASEESNEEEMHINLDLLERKKEAALIRMETQK